MSALGRKVLDLAEQQGLLDGKAIAELRRQVAESKFVVTPEAIAKVLVDHGHLTPFQARKLVSQAVGDQPDPIEERIPEKPKPKPAPRPVEDLTFADSTPEMRVVKPVDPVPKPAAREPTAREQVVRGEPAREAAANKSQDQKPPQQKLLAAPVQIVVPKSEEKPVAPLQPPVEGSTADDLGELKSIDPAPHTRGNRWKTDKGGEALNETVELVPIDLNAPLLTPLPPADLQPIDDLFGSEPAPASASSGSTTQASKPSVSSAELLKPVSPLKPVTPLAPVTTLSPVIRPRSVWDSPLMLIGGGSLGLILVAFALLFYALTRGSAAELFSKGEEEYRAGNYGNAIAIYEQFLKQYPEDPSASLARVRRGMANLRQVTDAGKNPRVGLEMAKQVLPQIESEEKFAEARSELATILPDIADGFATQASQTEEPARKNELVKLAGDTLALVNNPAYLPASVRKDRESHISRIVDKLKSAERGIQQEKDLVTTVESISKLVDKGNAAAAYELQGNLLRTYPGLATNPQLVAAIRQVGEKERELVKVTTGGPAPIKTDHPAGSERVIVSFRPERMSAAAAIEPVFFLLEGGIYGVDAGSGRILWRRFVGYETLNMPIAVGSGANVDAVFIDEQRHELVRVKGASGQLVWRQKLSGVALGPAIAGNRVLVTTQHGMVIALDAATGEIAASAQLPQGVVVAPAVRQSKVYQLGEHSTLFVLDANSLACSETVYLGHQAGELFVPPAAVLDQVLVVTSPADDYSEIQALSPDAKTKRLTPFGRPQRLKGRIFAPLAVSAARVAAMTDLGQVTVYDIDPAGAQEHIRSVAGVDASESTPRHGYCELDRNRLWVAGHRSTMFDVQSALSQLARKWTENHDDTFVAPPKLQGEILVTARRRSGVPAVVLEGCRASSGETVWTTHVAASISALVATDSSASVTALTAESRLYSVTDDKFKSGNTDEVDFSPDAMNASVLDHPFVSADGQTLVWTETQGGGRVYSYNVAAGGKPIAVTPAAKVVAPAIAALGGIIAPLANGSVALLGGSADSPITPYLPPLTPNVLPQWTRPAPLANGAGFVISDGRGAVYAVTKRDQPRPQLTAVENKTPNAIVSPLVLAGSTIVGVMRQESTDAIAGFDARAKSVFEPVPLEGRVEAGPFAVGGIVLVAAEPDGLVCIGGDGRVRWQQPPDKGFLAGPPLALPEGDLLVAYQSGVVCRMDAATGKELSRHEVGEPLAGPVCIWKSRAYLSGSDGVVHRISIPPRP